MRADRHFSASLPKRHPVLDHLEILMRRLTQEQREWVLADIENLDERQAIVDESRDAENKARTAE